MPACIACHGKGLTNQWRRQMTKLPCTFGWAVSISLLTAAFGLLAGAQDSRYAPREQQIPPPACFTMRGAWEGGYAPCNAGSHEEWLKDVTHWRLERRIRIGFDPARYEMPALK